jgi:hypothetical protein
LCSKLTYYLLLFKIYLHGSTYQIPRQTFVRDHFADFSSDQDPWTKHPSWFFDRRLQHHQGVASSRDWSSPNNLNSTNAFIQISTYLPLGTVVRILGAIQAVAALFIIFGDSLGGVILFFNVVVSAIVSFGPAIIKAITKQKLNSLISLLPEVSLQLFRFPPL